MKRLKIWTAVVLIVVMTVIMTGCQSSKSSKNSMDSSSKADNNENNMLHGQVSAISDGEITIKVAEQHKEPGEQEFTGEEQIFKITEETEIYKESGMEGIPQDEMPENQKKPEGEEDRPKKPEDSQGEKKEAPEPPKDSQGEKGKAPEHQTEEIQTGDIQSGDMVSISVDGDKAVTITIQNIPMDAPKAAASDVQLKGVYTINGKNSSSVNEAYESKEEDKSTVLVTNQGLLKMSGGVLKKTVDTSNDDLSNFYGLNAVFAVEDGGAAELYDSVLASSAKGANAVFSTGEDSKIVIDNIKIHTTGDSSRGLDATYGGSITATNVDITTEGAHCAPIATDRGEGTITVSGGTLAAAGDGSPCIYSTGDITVKNVEGTATGSQAAVVEGKNSITLEKCNLTGYGDNGIMLYQSTSGDAAKGTAVFATKDSTITTESKGPMFYITNTKAEADINNTMLNFGSGILALVSGNDTDNWGRPGENGGDFTLRTTGQKLSGDIVCDSISTVSVALTKKSDWTGTLNADQQGKEVGISLDTDSTWTLTGDSYVTTLEDKDESMGNIVSNGYTIHYDPSEKANAWLNGKTIKLDNGGKIMPK